MSTTRPDAEHLVWQSIHEARSRELGPDPDTLALQSIAASLIRIGNTMNCLDANLDLLREQLEPLDIRPGDQAQSPQTATGAPKSRFGEGSTGEQASPSPSAPPAAGL